MIQWRVQFCGVILDLPGRNNPFLSSTAFWLCVLLGSVKLYGICGLLLRALHPWYPLPGSLFCLITAGLTLSPLWAFSQMLHSHCLPWPPCFFTTFPTGTLPISFSALFFCRDCHLACNVTDVLILLFCIFTLEYKPCVEMFFMSVLALILRIILGTEYTQ